MLLEVLHKYQIQLYSPCNPARFFQFPRESCDIFHLHVNLAALSSIPRDTAVFPSSPSSAGLVVCLLLFALPDIRDGIIGLVSIVFLLIFCYYYCSPRRGAKYCDQSACMSVRLHVSRTCICHQIFPRESVGVCFYRRWFVCLSVTTIIKKIVDGFVPSFMGRFVGGNGRPSSYFVTIGRGIWK